MNVFQLIHTVLDELYQAIPGAEKEKDASIQGMLRDLSHGFAKLTTENKISYCDPATRFAYICRYVTSHSNLVYQRIKCTPTLTKLFKKSEVHVSCVGGGPGSDLLGLLKYVSEHHNCPTLRCHLLDGENAWADAWSDVDQKLQAPCKISTYFLPMDVCSPASWRLHSKYLSADLFTLIYFMSEVYCRRSENQPYFDHLFGKMKKGALLLYVDNNSSYFYDWFDGLAKKHAVEILESEEVQMGMTADEEKKDLGKYFKKFGSPKLDANVAYRICKKT